MSPFQFSKHEGKRVRQNRLIIPIDEPTDYTHYLACAVVVCVAGALLLLHCNAKRDVERAEYIRLCHKTCAVECHYQAKPIIPGLATYRRIKQGKTLPKDRPVVEALAGFKEREFQIKFVQP